MHTYDSFQIIFSSSQELKGLYISLSISIFESILRCFPLMDTPWFIWKPAWPPSIICWRNSCSSFLFLGKSSPIFKLNLVHDIRSSPVPSLYNFLSLSWSKRCRSSWSRYSLHHFDRTSFWILYLIPFTKNDILY